MKKLFCAIAAAAAFAAFADDDDFDPEELEPVVKDGDTVLIIGDSITQQSVQRPNGYWHLLTNALPNVNIIPLGFGGYQVGTWREKERASLTDASLKTWYDNPGWNLKEAFDGRINVVVIFLGMNDLLQPSIGDDEASATRWLAEYAEFVANLKSRCRPREFVFATITPLTADETSPKNRVRTRLNNRLRMLADALDERESDGVGVTVAEIGETVEETMLETLIAKPSYRLIPDFVHPNDLGHAAIAKAFLEAFGRDAEASAAELALARILVDLDLSAGDAPVLLLEPLRTNRPSDGEYQYLVHYRVGSDGAARPEVSLTVPEGWTVDEPWQVGEEGEFVVRGRPVKALTPIRATAGAVSSILYIPAPWKVRDGESGEWKFHTATDDYTGGVAPGSIDPFQQYFGKRENTIYARRRVKSEKARDVVAVFSHQTFSATLNLSLTLNGEEVFADSLNRNGKNRSAKTVRLRAGWNDVEVKCRNKDWQRQFSFDFEPVAGDDLSALEYSLE